MDFSAINWLAVIVAAIAFFGLGAVWYGPIFGKSWQKEVGLTDDDIQGGNMSLIFGSSFIMMLLMAFGIAMLLSIQHLEGPNWQIGVHTGLLVGVLFTATAMAINYLYQRKSIKLWLIDSGYQICFLVLQGLILGLWR